MAKRPKRAEATGKPTTVIEYNVQCPHCKTFLRGGFNIHTLRMLCYHCKNAIILDWTEQALTEDKP